MWSAKWEPFCLGLIVLTHYFLEQDHCNIAECNSRAFLFSMQNGFCFCFSLQFQLNIFQRCDVNDEFILLQIFGIRLVTIMFSIKTSYSIFLQHAVELPIDILDDIKRSLALFVKYCDSWRLISLRHTTSQITMFMGPTWGPPGSCRPQMGPMLAPLTLLSGILLLWKKLAGLVKVYCIQHCNDKLTHWGHFKMATTLQTTFSDAFSWMKICEFWLRFHLSLFVKFNQQYSSIGSDNGLAPTRQQAIIWTNNA